MENNSKKEAYKSMEEVVKKYLPEFHQVSILQKTSDAENLGVLIAKTKLKSIKSLLVKQNSD